MILSAPPFRYTIPIVPARVARDVSRGEKVKMGFLFSGIFWGIVLCLLGVSMILKVVFHLDIPVFRLVLASVLIVLGIRLLLGVTWKNGPVRNSILFSDGELQAGQDDRDFVVVFGRGRMDLAGARPEGRTGPIEFTTVFGSGRIRVDPTIPTKVTLSSAFAGARVPDGTQIAFGTYVYRTPGQSDDAPFLDVRATVVFGEIVVEAP